MLVKAQIGDGMVGRPPKREKKLKREVIYIPDEMLQGLTALAEARGYTGRSPLIRYILTQYLNEHNK